MTDLLVLLVLVVVVCTILYSLDNETFVQSCKILYILINLTS